MNVSRNVCALGALGLELKGIAKRLEGIRAHPAWDRARSGRLGETTVHLVRSGMGRAASGPAREAVATLQPGVLVCLGTAGALHPSLKIGSVVAALGILGPGNGDAPLSSSAALVEMAVRAGAVKGDAWTVASPLCTPESKREAGKRTEAAVCEMEAWHVARVAAEAGIPFLALKAVSDTVRDRLPDIGRFTDETGVLDAKRFGAYLAMHPAEAARSARFVLNARKASEALASVFGRACAHMCQFSDIRGCLFEPDLADSF